VASNCECGNKPSGSKNAGNFLTSCKLISISRRTLLYGESKQASKEVKSDIYLCGFLSDLSLLSTPPHGRAYSKTSI
jgi:hypothetical protein